MWSGLTTLTVLRQSHIGKLQTERCAVTGPGGLTDTLFQSQVQDIGKPYASLFHLSCDYRVRFVLIRGSNYSWIAISEVSVGHSLRQAVPFQHPIFDAAPNPSFTVLRCDLALQLHRECIGISANMIK